MIPRTIHFTIPATASSQQLTNIARARELHPDWNVIVWQDPVDPAKFVLSKYWNKVNSGAQLADLIRLEVVYQQGGFYLDADFVLARSLEPLRIYPFVIASEDGHRLTNAFFGAAPHSPVLQHLIDALNQKEPDWKISPEQTTGPVLFSRELIRRDDVIVIPRESFYPHNWNERPVKSRRWTYAVHLWDKSWRSPRGPRQRVRGLIDRAITIIKSIFLKALSSTRTGLLKSKRLLHLGRSHSYPASGIICAQTIFGPKIYLAGDDVVMTPTIALQGTYNFEVELFVQRIVRKGDWVIDVGANVGMLSLLSAERVGPFGRVFCYEADPIRASLLRKSLVANRYHDRVKVHEKTVRAGLGVTNRLLGGATIAANDSSATFESNFPLGNNATEVDEEISTLETEFPTDLPIRLLKVAAEGLEHHVLRGGQRLFERHCVDLILLDCSHELCGKNWNDFLSEIKTLIGVGYLPYFMRRSSKLTPITFEDISLVDCSRCVILVSKEALDTIRELK